MSAWFGQGMPYVDGKDEHGRICKLVRLAQADAWRMANTEVRADSSGRLRGLEMASEPSGAQPEPAPLPEAKGVSPPAGKARGSGALPAASSAGSTDPFQAMQIRIAEAKALGVESDAENKRLRMLQTQGKLLDREAAVGAHKAFVTRVGIAIDRMPSSCAALVAARLGVTEHDVFQALKDVVATRMRQTLARDARSSAEAARRARK
ncbi:hypothetical protein V7S57_02395 [Caulobacter sp. CCNWLY153]